MGMVWQRNNALFYSAAAFAVPVAEATRPAHISQMSISISLMLIGGITFFMSLFYLVNHPDNDMKRYSWQVISSTISIFCAVLFFEGCNGIVEEFWVRGGGVEWALAIGIVQMVVWFIGLQLVLAMASGSLGKRPNTLDEVELNMKSWATLFAHTCGFACIHCLGEAQQLPWFSRSPAALMAILPISALGLFCMYVTFDWIRWRVAHADDGEVDEYEEAWDKHAEEAENDVMGLSLSWAAIQIFQFAISGRLANAEGIEPPAIAYSHPGWQVAMLASIGVGLGCLTILCLFISKALHGKHEYIHRLAEITEVFASTGVGWCFFFAAKWGLSSQGFAHDENSSTGNVVLRVSLALLVSFLSFCVIFFLDKLADMDTTGHAAEEAIRTIVEALGLLVGFSWEQSFDTATDDIVKGFLYKLNPAFAKLPLSLLLASIVFPAWRFYILPTVMQLEKENRDETRHELAYGHRHGHDHAGEQEKGEERGGHSDHTLHKEKVKCLSGFRVEATDEYVKQSPRPRVESSGLEVQNEKAEAMLRYQQKKVAPKEKVLLHAKAMNGTTIRNGMKARLTYADGMKQGQFRTELKEPLMSHAQTQPCQPNSKSLRSHPQSPLSQNQSPSQSPWSPSVNSSPLSLSLPSPVTTSVNPQSLSSHPPNQKQPCQKNSQSLPSHPESSPNHPPSPVQLTPVNSESPLSHAWPSAVTKTKSERGAAAKVKDTEEVEATTKVEEEAQAKTKAEEEAAAKAKAEEDAAANAKSKKEAAARVKAEEEALSKAKAEEEAAAKTKVVEEPQSPPRGSATQKQPCQPNSQSFSGHSESPANQLPIQSLQSSSVSSESSLIHSGPSQVTSSVNPCCPASHFQPPTSRRCAAASPGAFTGFYTGTRPDNCSSEGSAVASPGAFTGFYIGTPSTLSRPDNWFSEGNPITLQPNSAYQIQDHFSSRGCVASSHHPMSECLQNVGSVQYLLDEKCQGG